MELEEERRSHQERDQCIKEQQMKINNLSNLVTLSDSEKSSSNVNLEMPSNSFSSYVFSLLIL